MPYAQVRQTVAFANHMAAVERLIEFSALPPEEPPASGTNNCLFDSPSAPSGWPVRGELRFVQVVARYPGAAERHFCIDGATFACAAGLRTALCGRSGSGKTSLVRALAHPILTVIGK